MNERSIGIIGTGKLGADVAFMLAERDLADVRLYDVDRDKSSYLASDLTETVFGGGYTNRITAVKEIDELRRCDVILIAAGKRRAAGDSPEDLFGHNRPLIQEIAAAFSGASTLFIVASEPVDLLTTELARLMRLPFSRVLGLGGVLDSYRVRHTLGEAMQVNPDYIRSQVVGPHGRGLQPLWDFTSINGIPIRSIVEETVLTDVAQVLERENGDQALAAGSSRYAPAVACLDLLDAIIRDERRILSTTVLWENILGLSGVAMAIPCVVGRLGAERMIVPSLAQSARKAISGVADQYSGILKGANA